MVPNNRYSIPFYLRYFSLIDPGLCISMIFSLIFIVPLFAISALCSPSSLGNGYGLGYVFGSDDNNDKDDQDDTTTLPSESSISTLSTQTSPSSFSPRILLELSKTSGSLIEAMRSEIPVFKSFSDLKQFDPDTLLQYVPFFSTNQIHIILGFKEFSREIPRNLRLFHEQISEVSSQKMAYSVNSDGSTSFYGGLPSRNALRERCFSVSAAATGSVSKNVPVVVSTSFSAGGIESSASASSLSCAGRQNSQTATVTLESKKQAQAILEKKSGHKTADGDSDDVTSSDGASHYDANFSVFDLDGLNDDSDF